MTNPTSAQPGSPPRTIVHVDMDAFYASAEILRRPELRGQPVIVGGEGRRGVVAAASYEARYYGVRSAMSSVQARRLCPSAVFIGGDHAHYREISDRIFEIMQRVTPTIEPLSLDEAFLDVTAARRLFGPGREIASTLRTMIYDEVGLWCSAGVARNKFLAKLCSEHAKPSPSRGGPVPGHGVFVLAPSEELAFLHALPARALWGVGPATMARLDRLGVVTVADIAALPIETLVSAVGSATGHQLFALSRAHDDRPVDTNQQTKSISHEETFATDRLDSAALATDIVRLSDAVGGRLRKSELVCRTIAIKVRFGDFRTITRSKTVDPPTDSGAYIGRVAQELMDQIDVSAGIRLLGVSATGLGAETFRQLTLDDLADEPNGDWRQAEAAVDEIRRRFGSDAIGPAALVEPGEGLRTRSGNEKPWG